MVRSKKKSNGALTDVELEMMTIVWRIGPCSVHEILRALPAERSLAYTSVSTMVRILEQKGYVVSSKDGRGHLYQACIGKDDYEAQTVAQVVRSVFDGEPTLLVHRLIASCQLSADDLAAIRRLIDEGELRS